MSFKIKKKNHNKFTMRINSGQLKGRMIPFLNKNFDDAQTTSQRLKEAFFSIAGINLEGLFFLDMFSCSGQIGLEAYSRYAETTCMELDITRFDNLKRNFQAIGADSVALYNCDSISKLSSQGFSEKYDIVFIDPPYDKFMDGVPFCIYSLGIIQENLNEDALVGVQHNSRVDLPEKVGDLFLEKQKKHGKSCLSIYYYKGSA